MSRNTQSISSFCERINDVDPDLRQMALFDLQQQLNNAEFSLSEGEQDRVVPPILNAFTVREVNSEVHSQTVRMLTTLIPKLSAKNRAKVTDKLISTLWDAIPDTKNAEAIRTLRENSLMGLKAVVEGLTDDNKDTVQSMVPRLLAGLRTTETSISTDIFDVLAELIRKFGRSIADKHAEIQSAAVASFNGALSLRKKAVAVVANLCIVSSDALFNQVLDLTLEGLGKDKGEKLRRHIQLCNTISRVAGDRFGSSVAKVIPPLFAELKRLEAAPEDESQSIAADEVRENILQALDSFISRCPNHVTELFPEIVQHCGGLMKWDPNYCEMSDDDEEEFDDEYDEIDDDDDASWKVRKSAARCLVSTIRARPDQLPMIYSQLCDASEPLLPSRFKERVENVRLEVLEVFRSLLEASKHTFSADGHAPASGSFQLSSALLGGSFRMIVEARAEARALVPIKKQVVKALLYAVKHKSPKVKLAVFHILRDLFALIGSELADQIPDCSQVVVATLKDPKLALPQLRPDVLNFTRVLVSVGVMLQRDEANAKIIPSLEALFTPVFEAAEKDRYFKTVVAALRVCLEFVACVRVSASPENLAINLFNCVSARLATTDADQDVKKASVDAMAAMLRSLEGSLIKALPGKLEETYKQLLVLLKNETTRLAVSKAILLINNCRVPAAVLKDYAAEIATFLRKSDRQLRESALRTLGTMVSTHHASIDASTLSFIVSELCNESSPLLNDKELFLTSLGLQLLKNVSKVPSQLSVVTKSVVPRVLKLLQSPLIQGQCVTDAAALFSGLTARKESSSDVLKEVVSAAKKADVNNVANLSVVLGHSLSPSAVEGSRSGVISDFVKLATTSGCEIVGLTCLGEIGRFCDISGSATSTIRNSINTNQEDVKAAASTALGKAAASPSAKKLLEELVADVQKNVKQSYFLLRALKETITTVAASNAPLATDSKQLILTLLLDLCKSTDEGIPDIVAECYGRMTHVDPAVISSTAATLKTTENGDVASTLLAAMKYAVTGASKNSIDSQFAEHCDFFLSYLNHDAPLKVRRSTIQLFGQVAYAKPQLVLVEKLKTQYLPGLFAELVVNKALISEVDLGPFKHIVDNGLEVRKMSFECVGTLIDGVGRSRSVLDYAGNHAEVVEKITNGLAAPEIDLDIISSVRTMLIKLAKTAAGQAAIIANVDKISEYLQKIVTTAPKDGQEKEKVVEGQRHSIVTALKLEAIPGIAQSIKFGELMAKVRSSPHFAAASQQANQE